MKANESYEEAASVIRQPLRLDQKDIKTELVRYATLAANGHNTQPWLFEVSSNTIRIKPDYSRTTPVVDPDHHHLFVSLGCATENLVLAAEAAGFTASVAVEGDVVVVKLDAGRQTPSELFSAIPLRQSTRSDYAGRAVSNIEINQLSRSSSLDGVATAVLATPDQLSRLRDLVVAATESQIADPSYVAELKSWMRFNASAALTKRDGLFSATSGNPSLPDWIASRMFSMFLTPKAEGDKYARHVMSSAGAIVFSSTAGGPAGWVNVGRSCQRFALQATALGIQHAFINQPVEVASFRDDLSSLSGWDRSTRPDIVIRFGYGPLLPRSLRRPVMDVITS